LESLCGFLQEIPIDRIATIILNKVKAARHRNDTTRP
jgi:hypothetical protein